MLLHRSGVARLPGVVIDVAEVESNIVVFRLAPGSPPPSAVVDRMKQAGVLVLGFRGGIRVVTHLQVTPASLSTLITIPKVIQGSTHHSTLLV